ncbi:GAB3 protein, partial [Chloropsis hardwickii]|nr:GAB3 protein [Chloropsis hardwickii]
MSSGDVVCTGWLIKSPPEKKLKRYAWRKRWFVLRRGRMSGNPDVLEYYRNNHSKKPIRTIDLNECQVLKHSGPNFIKKEFQNNFVFIVRTTYRTFYLVAKTEEEMQVWVRNISQICNFGHLEDGTGRITHTLEAGTMLRGDRRHGLCWQGGLGRWKRAVAPIAPYSTEMLLNPDLKLLKDHSGAGWKYSLAVRSHFDEAIPAGANSRSLIRKGAVNKKRCCLCEKLTVIFWGHLFHYMSCIYLVRLNVRHLFQESILHSSHFLRLCWMWNVHRLGCICMYINQRGEEAGGGALQNGHAGICRAQVALVPRRISLSSLDNMRNWKADMEGSSLRSRDKRLSLNLPCRFSPLCSAAADGAEDSYVPMRPSTSPSAPGSDCSPDGYIPMSPGSATFTFPVVSTEKLTSPLPELPSDVEPPPVNRDLKPRRKSRPPPLDLRNLSTIREHAAVTRMWTVPYNRMSFISPERDGINSARIFANSVSGEEEEKLSEEKGSHNFFMLSPNYQQATSPYSGAFPWTRKSNLDYLALDFNSASPSPVQKKPFLSEEQRVDYVQVDEQKTQALQNTKQEWTDERQSKV